MKKIMILTILLILALWSPAWACDSYEDCMDLKPLPKGSMLIEKIEPPDRDVLKAIAYKLDEISKKLDYSGEERSQERQEKEFTEGMKSYWKHNAINYLSKKGYTISEKDLGNVEFFAAEYYHKVKDNCVVLSAKDFDEYFKNSPP